MEINDTSDKDTNHIHSISIEKGYESVTTENTISCLDTDKATDHASEDNSNKISNDDQKLEDSSESIYKSPKDSLKDSFKKPVLLIGPRKGNPTKLKTLPGNKTSEVILKSELDKLDKLRNNLPKLTLKCVPTIEIQREQKLELPYKEPAWSGNPEETYKLEVLKSGVILEVIDLSNKSFHVVGRLPSCDISMAHPTISRFHAIIQYRAIGDDKNGKGLYIYDLGSTHGTFWNSNQIKSRVYVRLQGGHIIKFGCSQRKFIIQAPSDDQEEESEYSVTELKEMRKLQLEERDRLEKQRLLEEQEKERLKLEKEENEGIDWGMGEDADEETDLTENPYAQSNNEELFLDDPKKTLRGWFEREGLDLQYNTEDKGIGRFLCWVNLPLDDGRTTRAEALVTGKKKEAVVQCALEACRVLDRYGLLRQANHEARKRKSRNWEEEDYYDSDEDNFLDRTGTIEKKREQRMKLAGKLETKAETYESLLEKYSEVTRKITSIENTITLHKLRKEQTDDLNEDALDTFMSTLDSSTLNKSEIRTLKIELLNLRKEEMQLLKLINIAKPANLPPLKPHIPIVAKKSKNLKDLNIIIGNKKKLKMHLVEKPETIGELDKNCDISEDYKTDDSESSRLVGNIGKDTIGRKKGDLDKSLGKESVNLHEENFIDNDRGNDEIEKESLKRKIRNMKRNQQRLEKSEKEIQKHYDEDEFREDYSTWIPPDNQTGDGRTSLNEKFGY